jgi:hypothetical protein
MKPLAMMHGGVLVREDEDAIPGAPENAAGLVVFGQRLLRMGFQTL